MKKLIVALICCISITTFAQFDKGVSIESFIQETQTRYNVRIYYSNNLLMDLSGQPLRMNQRMMNVDTLKGRIGILECLLNAEVKEVDKRIYAIRLLDNSDKEIRKSLKHLRMKNQESEKTMQQLRTEIAELKQLQIKKNAR